jgi:hypothetical protein
MILQVNVVSFGNNQLYLEALTIKHSTNKRYTLNN